MKKKNGCNRGNERTIRPSKFERKATTLRNDEERGNLQRRIETTEDEERGEER